MNVAQIPFNAFIGIERAQGSERLLALPEHPRYLNHLGTVHASALLALAEASSTIRPSVSGDAVLPCS